MPSFLSDAVGAPADASSPAFGQDSPAHWLATRAAGLGCAVTRLPIDSLPGWTVAGTPPRLRHESGRYFQVGGFEVTSAYGAPRRWIQPALLQFEIGLLGLFARRGADGLELLIQAKAEPGDIGGAQAAPTIQATRSNYQRVHRGALPLHYERFRQRDRASVLVDQLQPEHGAFFLRKYNRNVVLMVERDAIEVGPNFRWMTLGGIRSLLRRPNAVNMSLRSVLSCLPEGRATDEGAAAAAPPPWFTAFARAGRMSVRAVPLDSCDMARFIGVRAEAPARETRCWHQPLLEPGAGGIDLYVRRRRGGEEMLLRAAAEPGHRKWLALGPTWCSYASDAAETRRADFVRRLEESNGGIRFAQFLSEDGGRFNRFQNLYRIIELAGEQAGPLPPGYGWMDTSLARALAARGLATIELRTLLACLRLGGGAARG